MKAIIIHGWGGSPEGDWIPWLKKELTKQGLEVLVPVMPDTERPKIEPWVKTLTAVAGEVNEDTILIAHSIGCQTVLRYLENLSLEIKIKAVVLVAPWMELDEETIKEEGEEGIEIAKPWVETPIDFNKVRLHTDKFIAIFSDNDPFVPLNQKDLFANELGADVLLEHAQGHFNDQEYPIILENVLNAIK